MANLLQNIKKSSFRQSSLGVPHSGELGGQRGRNKITVCFRWQLGFTPKFQFCVLLPWVYVRHDEEEF